MKFSEQWLGEWLGAEVDSEHLLERLTMSGLEVDGVEPAAAEFSGVVVARVLKVEPHPDADKLRVCSVDCNDSEPLQIVCGASNVRQDLFVPLAKIGARLPGDFKIKKSKLRGIESFGMLCSEKELGLADDAEGLMELPSDFTIGEDIRTALKLEDNIIELSLTPNRGDCFSVSGIARDVAVFCNVPYQAIEITPVDSGIDDVRSVQLNVPEACANYVGRIIKGVDISKTTPLWMVEKLRRSNIRSINPIVDITNFVMLELGQPMHAFDNDKLEGSVQVRYANKKEKLTLLDGQECELDEETLVIADEKNPLAMAGIMGGLDSSVSESTADVFLESAFFKPEMIIGDARKYGLHTDSSHRFERGVDFKLQEQAVERATQLVQEVCGGKAGPVIKETDEAALPRRDAVMLRSARIQRVLGIEVDDTMVHSILEQLGLEVKTTEEGWEIIPPSYRFDINIETDLIEEIARVIGYDNIETESLASKMSMHAEPISRTVLEKIRNLLICRGYQEAITYSFVEPSLNELFNSDDDSLILANPISAEMSVMRSSLIPGLVQALQYNVNRQQARIRMFESGLVFKEPKNLKQILNLAGIIYGEVEPEQWDKKTSSSDFFDLKSDIEAILGQFIQTGSVKFLASKQKFLHPGQSSEIVVGDQVVGFIGALHPSLLQKLDLAKGVFAFDLDLSAICIENVVKCHEISKFPSVRRDISILVNEAISVAEICENIKKSASDLLTNLELFDLYQGEHIDIGKKSLTFGLTFQRSSSTLTDTEVESTVNGILGSLADQFGATLRE